VNGPLIVAITMLMFGLIAFSKSAVLVPEGSAYVVERLGRYSQTLDAGFHVLVPFLDVVRFRQSLAEQSLPLGAVASRTRDDREVFVDGTLAYRITDAERASYAVADLRQGLTGVTQHAMREAVGSVPLDELHASRASVEAAVLRELAPKTTRWGVEPLRHEITDISRQRKESHT
jgi:regulator of protease activity HflC (stomatin/prohibitin superfamily)